MQYYEECSKKKMRGLAPAIQAAEELYKKRIETISKATTVNNEDQQQKSKPRPPAKNKPIKKVTRNKKEE
jgi:hypothetical protein